MTVVIGDKSNSLLTSFTLNSNAHHIFSEFLKEVNNNKVQNDGKNALLNIIDKYISNDKSNRFRKTIKCGRILYRARLIDPIIIDELKEHIVCGEVSSVKKFVYCQKDSTSLTPVYLSDWRAQSESEFPIRNTWVDINEIS